MIRNQHIRRPNKKTNININKAIMDVRNKLVLLTYHVLRLLI